MARKKKRSLTARGVIGLGKGLWFLTKASGKGIIYLSKKAIKKSKDIKELKEERTKEELRPKINAQYEKFEIIKTLDGNYEKFEEKLFNNQSIIGIILGARGTGKSAIGMKLLENIKSKTNRNVCVMGFKKENLPNWISVFKKTEEIPNGSFVLIDEAGIEFSSRDSMSSANKILSNLLLISRHKDLSVAFISQNSSNLEINVIRQADFLILKPSSLMQKDFERKKIKDIYSGVTEHFEEYKDINGLTYIYSTDFRGFVTNNLPSFWSKEVSKSYK